MWARGFDWMRRFERWALGVPIFVKIVGISVVVMVVFGSLTLWHAANHVSSCLNTSLEQRVTATARSLARELERLMAEGDLAALQRRVDEIRRGDEDIYFLAVLDASGTAVAESFPGTMAPPAADSSEAPSGLRQFGVRIRTELREKVVEVVEPIGGGRLGAIHLGVTDRAVRESLADLGRQVVLGFAICLLIAAGMAALLTHLVTRPVGRLAAAAERIAQGDFDVELASASDDEIGRLAAAFQRMTESLARYRREFEETHRSRTRLMERLVEAQEEERKAISRELHDQIGPTLSDLLLTVQTECDVCPADRRRCLKPEHVEKKLHALIRETHSLARGMRPPILDDFGLKAALERYLDEVARKTGLEIDFQHNGLPGAVRLASRMELTLYRIVQEAVTNVIRHAEARHVSVVLLQQSREVLLLVEDDGRGFTPAARDQWCQGRLGLLGMRERAALCSGICTVESAVGRGTTIRVQIPLKEENLCQSES